jgi:MFS transporter, DHA1 family, multidrug resistance protein
MSERAATSGGNGGYLGTIRAQPMLVPLLLIMMLVMSGMGVITPVISIYAQSFGVGVTLIGMTITIFGVARLVVNLPAGMVSERYGRRTMLWLGPLVLAVGSVGAAMAGTFWALLFWRFVQGVGSGIYMTVAFAAAADLSEPANRGRVMALNQTALLTGASLGPAMGGILADLFDYRAPFWGFAVVAGLGCLVAIFFLPETRPQQPGVQRTPPVGLGIAELVSDGRFMAVTLVTFGTFFTRTAAQWTLIPLVGFERLGLSATIIGASLTGFTIATLLVLPAAGWLIDRFGQATCIVLPTCIAAAGLLLIAIAPSFAPWLAGLLILGLSLGVTGPASSAYAADTAPAGRFGPAMGMVRTTGDLGFVAGPLLAGLAVDFLPGGYFTALAANALLLVATVAAFAWMAGRAKRS